ncbi:uncharacterized protein LOC124606125 [Schistocerca americana]|uniref:uncharacterized protein LOC124606125 n=1 Tax=Schistocerca americana TaxID=7009 RepID=UPI001F4FE7F0|nr:uncharacterized protein LOC124606125 [Schistocerca americana]
MVTCMVFGCTNRSDCDAKSKGITFHVFPKNESWKALWENAVRRKNWCASKWITICSQHFREEDIDRTSLSTVRLRENAVPSVFPTHAKHLQKGDKKRKPSLRKESSSFPSSVLAAVSRVQDEEVPALVPEYTAGPPERSQTSSESEELKTKCEHLIRKTDPYKKQIKTLQQSSERWQLLSTENGAATTDNDHDCFATGIYLSEVAVHIVVYIAGCVVRHLEKTLKCEPCLSVLRGDGSHVAYSLIHRKSRGWLVLPSNDVFDICVCVKLSVNHFWYAVQTGDSLHRILIYRILETEAETFYRRNKNPALPYHQKTVASDCDGDCIKHICYLFLHIGLNNSYETVTNQIENLSFRQRENTLEACSCGSFYYTKDRNSGIIIVRWADKNVRLASSFCGIHPRTTIKRQNMEEEKKTEVPCPNTEKQYSKHGRGRAVVI